MFSPVSFFLIKTAPNLSVSICFKKLKKGVRRSLLGAVSLFLKKIVFSKKKKSIICRSLKRGSAQFVNARQRVKSRPGLLLYSILGNVANVKDGHCTCVHKNVCHNPHRALLSWSSFTFSFSGFNSWSSSKKKGRSDARAIPRGSSTVQHFAPQTLLPTQQSQREEKGDDIDRNYVYLYKLYCQ